MADIKLAWHELSPDMFPKKVQELIQSAKEARQQAAAATAVADEALQAFAGRIAVPNLTGTMVPLVQDGHSMVISHRFGKLTVASAPKEAKSSSKTKAALV